MNVRGIFAGFAVATAFFTRIPVATPASHAERLADAAWAFPLVGAGIGEPISAGLALIAAHAASRATLPVAMFVLAPARADGLGAAAGRPRGLFAIEAPAIGLLITLAALGPERGAAAFLLAAAAVFALGLLAQRRIGGYTGDDLGAFQQVAEIVILVTAAAK